MEQQLSEELIRIWLRISGVLKNNRLISSMTFNEIFVCNILYQQKQSNSALLTATDVGLQMKLLKSQMNKVLNSLEKQGLLRRIRSDEDKRKVYLELVDENIGIYLKEHERVLKMLEQLILTLGEEKVQQVISLMTEVTDSMERIIEKGNVEQYHGSAEE